ncbi:peptidoglycan DD-metalloendopeptidase family protein [Leptothoe kymatousa]|uniref:Peptidoglycan DD-metalloendopeptidase family protein n=1 Tax=Leptothoe kymatousa TAU-MAC 1615 TaxID=2364775 RepID=A0ABS5Y0N1_9CYAN|nr:peptidoglycan DD-metalloendopeptidase family protein [Leptothoe kymatousa]MBT9311038.1 peptidoglycan DD-metalloendopeptidase family protein [Leptothoe kymatousa TAU-MAC 1615]
MISETEQAPSGNAGRTKSAAMLGLALSFGASGVLFADSEATAAVGSFEVNQSEASSESPQLPSVLGSQLERSSVNSQGLTVYHTVEQGDSLWQIAKDHQVEIQDIKVANSISPDATLQVGQVIKVPGEEAGGPTLVSLLPGIQTNEQSQGQAPSLERLLATIPDAESSAPAIAEASELSDAVEEPVVVATEELTGDVSLRSAGIVSQSDGFQADLQQLAVRNTDTEQIEVTAASVEAEEVSIDAVEVDSAQPAASFDEDDSAIAGYEIRPGDTVENIATTLGTTAEELADVNGLENPDFIVAGETLAVPEDTANVLVASEELADNSVEASTELAAAGIGGFDGTRLARLQSTVERPINVPTTMQRLRGDEATSLIESALEVDAEETAEVIQVEDPYTADLLADIGSAQQLNASSTQEEELVAVRQTASVGSTVVNPEFVGGTQASDIAEKRAELLAAAPLDPSAYVSSPAPSTGQVVSPEMPILPSADEYLPEAPDYFNGYIWPTRGTLTSGYGWRWGRMHRGIDVAGPVGTPIVSAAAGVVERAGWNSGGYGNLVEVRHADGSMTRYAHNSRIVVRPGQRVNQGQHIADMGSTGYSTGPHLHFEVHMPEQGTVNPMAMLPNR